MNVYIIKHYIYMFFFLSGSVFELQSDEGTDWCSELSTSNQNFSDCVSGEEEQTRDMFSLKGFEMASCDSTGSSIPPWLQQVG